MQPQLITTKFRFPIYRQGLISRPRLTSLLEAGLQNPLTLVSAPAGYGKSTLLAEWRSEAGREKAAAWLSLEAADNDPARFWLYLAAAIDQIQPGLAHETLALVQTPPLPTTETILSYLLREIESYAADLVLVLDDWHVITDASLQAGLAFLVGHQPANLHLGLLTRSDPSLPLSRLRANHQMVELRAEQLRFSPEEAARFLTEGMGLDLTSEHIVSIDRRSEGWIAGLQLAALSMQGRSCDQVDQFIAAFTGSHRYIVDYLAEEVLSQQPDELRNFLLKTAILDRMTPGLCEAITGSPDAQAIMHRLEQGNLFVIPLDDERRWVRYHHLFRDLLHSSLLKAYPEQVEELHRRASAWYAGHNYPEEAIGHALAGRDYDRAAELVEAVAQGMDMQNKLAGLARWIQRLPDEVVAAHPWLSIYRAWGSQWTGPRNQVAPWLQAAEQAIQSAGPQPMSDSERRHLTGHIAAIRAHAALTGEAIAEVLAEGQKALALLPEGDEMRCETAVALGGAYWALGDVIQSEAAFTLARNCALQTRFSTMAVPSTCYVGMQQTKQGRLQAAAASYWEALRLAAGPEGKETPVAGFPNVKLGDLFREWNELEGAEAHLRRGVEQCLQLGQADVLTDGYVCLARYQMAKGSSDEARSSLTQASRVLAQTKVDPFVQSWVNAAWLRLWIQEHNLEAVDRWIETCELDPEDPLSYHYDLHHITLARGLIERSRGSASSADLEAALRLLTRLLEAAAKAGWIHEMVQILLLQAVASGLQACEQEAMRALWQALALAEPGGYVRTFIDEGEPLWVLVERLGQLAAANNIAGILGEGILGSRTERITRYLQRLITALPAAVRQAQPGRSANPASPSGSLSGQAGELLTPRETEVLRLIEAGCSNQEISHKLVIALGTTKRHTVNIFTKLDVTSRTQAVARARELGILRSDR